jgi:hypothetical protein
MKVPFFVMKLVKSVMKLINSMIKVPFFMTKLVNFAMKVINSVTKLVNSVTDLINFVIKVPLSVTKDGTSVADFGVFLSLFRTKTAAQTTAPVNKFQCTVNGFPLSAEFIFNRKGAAVFAHAAGLG